MRILRRLLLLQEERVAADDCMKCELLVYVLPQNSVDCVGRQPQCWAAVYSPALSSHDDGPLNRPHRLEILVDSNSFHEDDEEIQLPRRSLINSQRLNIKYSLTTSADWRPYRSYR
uniref:Uncharacterized protein n=1 Tax=Haemonchus contortus TaxID=6289 RepID=A0A7I4YH01_HAECO